MTYYVDILRLQNDQRYVGSTGNLDRRLTEHRSGSGSQTTHKSPLKELFYSEAFPDLHSALRHELQLKGWSHARKLAPANGDLPELKRLARRRERA